jgi:hypothetical protein
MKQLFSELHDVITQLILEYKFEFNRENVRMYNVPLIFHNEVASRMGRRFILLAIQPGYMKE